MADSWAVDAAQAAGFEVASTTGLVEEALSGSRLHRLQRVVESADGKVVFADTGVKASMKLFDGVAGKEILIEALEEGAAGNNFDITLVLPADDNQAHALAITDTSAPTQATATLDPAGADNSLIWTAVPSGVDGNDLSVRYVLPTDTNVAVPLSVSVATNGQDVTVSLEVDTDGSTVLTTGTSLVADWAEAAAASGADLLMTPSASGTITGILAAVSKTMLTGGLDNPRTASVSLEVDTDGSTVLTTAAALVTAINDDNSMNDIVVASLGQSSGARQLLAKLTFVDLGSSEGDNLILTSKVNAAEFAAQIRRPRGKTELAATAVACELKPGNLIDIMVPAGKTLANIKTALEAVDAIDDLVTVTTAGTDTHVATFERIVSGQASRANRGETILTAATVESAISGVDSELVLRVEPAVA